MRRIDSGYHSLLIVTWWLGCIGAIALAIAIRRHPAPVRGDIALATWLQTRPLDTLASIANDLAYSPVTVILGLVCAGWLLKRRLIDDALCVTLAVAIRPLNSIVKQLVDRPRPGESDVRVAELAGGYSFPSGHAFGSAMLYGAFALLVCRSNLPAIGKRIVIVFLLMVIVSCGVARVYVGAHWPTDVGGSWLFAALWIGLLARIAGLVRKSIGPLDHFS